MARPHDEQRDAAAAASADAPDGAAPPIVAELRHIAGLTAGRSLPLRPGTLSVGLSPTPEGGLTEATPSTQSFDLVIGVDGAVQLIAGAEPVAVEGVLVDRTAHLDDGDVIQLRSGHFQLRAVQPQAVTRPDEPLTPRAVFEPTIGNWPPKWCWWLCAVLVMLGIVLGVQRTAYFGLSLIGIGGAIALLVLRRRKHALARSEHARVLSNAKSLFFNQILDSRKFAADAARASALHPFEVARRSGASSRSIGERLPVTLASGDRAWTPPVERLRDTGWNDEAIVDELSFLPAIPVTMDLATAPIAITGDRRGALAVARHLITCALLHAPSDRGVAVNSLVPADWQWLTARAQPMLRILDGVAGPWSPRTIVIASSPEGLARLGDPRVFGAVLEVAVDGSTTITGPEGTFGTDLIAHGITEAQAREVQESLRSSGPTIDLRDSQPVVDLSDPDSPDTGRPDLSDADPSRADLAHADLSHAGLSHAGPVDLSDTEKGPWTVDGPSTWLDPLADATTVEAPGVEASGVAAPLGADRVVVSGPDVERNKDVLASAALLQARQHPDRAIFILDRGDRALIRLSQLANCQRYVAIDQVRAVSVMVSELAALDESADVLLLAPDLWDAIAFYRNSDEPELADRLDTLVERVRVIPMAASSQGDVEAPDTAFLVWVDSRPTPMTASVHTAGRPPERQFIDPTQLPGIDLTGSVARLIAPTKETP